MKYCGRDFSISEINHIRQLIAENPQANRLWLSKRVCEFLQWLTPGGLTKDMLALFGFGASAWMVAPRDKFIGWNHAQRQSNLHLVVNNARFLILPWVHSTHLASRLLGMVSRQIADDWQNRYSYRPLMLETFVETPRFRGTAYKAANWICVGQTQGRGKLGQSWENNLPIKNIWLYSLHKRFRQLLCK